MLHLDKSDSAVLAAEARRLLCEESEAIERCARNLDRECFATSVALLSDCKGRVVVTGIGKAGAVGRKFAGTLCSTGAPALFLHPADAQHGDLGVLRSDDVVCVFSYSGETDEVLAILPAVRRIGAPIIALTSRAGSTLGQLAHVVLAVDVEREACPMNLSPTTSTTVMLALSDALAIVTMQAKHFTRFDFAERHPAGSLGRRLSMRVKDIMRTGSDVAVVAEDVTLLDAMLAVQRAHAGAAIAVDSSGALSGMMVEGDFRRQLTQDRDSFGLPLRSVMNRKPGTLQADMPVTDALTKLEEFHPVKGEFVGEAPVIDGDRRPVGMLMLKDLLKAGIASSI